MQITVTSIQSVPGNVSIVERACVGRDQANAQDKAEVTHTVDQKGLHVGEDGGGLVEPETDQQVRHQAHGFPAEEQLQHVVAHDEHQHGEGKQRDVGEETVVAFVFFHVADGVDVHHQRHEGHHAHHHGRQAVDQEAHFHLEATDHHPGVERLVEPGTVDHVLERHGRQDEGHQHAQNGQGVRQATANPVTTELRTKNTGQCRAHQGRERHNQQRACVEGLTHILINP
jgi:hypothetical protein